MGSKLVGDGKTDRMVMKRTTCPELAVDCVKSERCGGMRRWVCGAEGLRGHHMSAQQRTRTDENNSSGANRRAHAHAGWPSLLGFSAKAPFVAFITSPHGPTGP